MDHHCEWLQTCIGLRNYKFFIVMIFYGNCFFQFMVTSYVKFAWDAVFNATVSLWSSYFILMVFLIMVVINLRFIGLLILHIFLISTGRTSREFLKNQEFHIVKFRENIKASQLPTSKIVCHNRLINIF